jgi:hypothetical protein
MDPPFDPEILRFPGSATATLSRPVRPPRHGPGEGFLKGPIPWAWLDRAGRLPGKALAVSLILWQKAGMTGKRTVHLCQARADGLGLNQDSTRRGIRELEHAGVIEVRRRPGRGLVITLLDVRDQRHEDR